MGKINFTDNNGSFKISKPENISYLYFPLASETGLKSAVTPNLGGDAKLDQESFLLEPVSAENLHSNRAVRNFWCVNDRGNVVSLAGVSPEEEARKFTSLQDESLVEAGYMNHRLTRNSKAAEIVISGLSFVPVNENVEVLLVTVKNTSEESQKIRPYAAIPIYGRSADNIRDHRNVTSMLHRIYTDEQSVKVCPTMSFDEKGHRRNQMIYYVAGVSSTGEKPECFYPSLEGFIGEGGLYTRPRSVFENIDGVKAGAKVEGREAMGAFRFPETEIKAGEEKQYILLLGADKNSEKIDNIIKEISTVEKVQELLEETVNYWTEKTSIHFTTGNKNFDNWMRWVAFQPFLRRLFGCSFLPHHDYGRGGRGWRDLWQDCLSLLLMTPGDVGRMIELNYGGVRIDGTNATIIGEGDGNFIADRNGIARVWMDHALWPLMTTKMYIDQTGDIDILLKKAPYFKDTQVLRGTSFDNKWSESYGNLQLTEKDEVYKGTVLEHILIEQLAAFYEVGEHNIMRLRGADWNDALDMASQNGESVAFTYAYAGNLKTLAEIIRNLNNNDTDEIEVLAELTSLLAEDSKLYEDKEAKQKLLMSYAEKCEHKISGDTVKLSLNELADNLENKAEWLFEFLRKQEWLENENGEGWFNSYYDNSGNRVEGIFGDAVRMMLTGQVFAIMGGTADNEQISKIVTAADKYLYRKEIGGYRLNTNFNELKFDMGRMFGFAYGEKENGAVFSHMTVMFANALYKRGFAKEGWKALYSLAETALNFETSRIYPGIPEYFRTDGRGMYHYLTGAASWYLMTMVTEVFGVKGELGNLTVNPKLTASQFDEDGKAEIKLSFADKKFTVVVNNPNHKEYGEYNVTSALLDGESLTLIKCGKLATVNIPRCEINALSDELHNITVTVE